MTTSPLSASADTTNEKLLALLEQLVANQTITATADLQREIAERLAETHQRHARPGPTGTTATQAQLVLRFRALRNGLGNLSRLSSGDDVRMPAPTLFVDGTLTFVDPLPAQAATVRIFGSDGQEIQRFDGVGGAESLSPVRDDVTYLQVDDRDGTPILLGVPLRADIIL